MSKMLDGFYKDTDFDIGDVISFDHDGERLLGNVVRVYASRLLYHVEVDGRRYEVEVPGDDPRRERNGTSPR